MSQPTAAALYTFEALTTCPRHSVRQRIHSHESHIDDTEKYTWHSLTERYKRMRWATSHQIYCLGLLWKLFVIVSNHIERYLEYFLYIISFATAVMNTTTLLAAALFLASVCSPSDALLTDDDKDELLKAHNFYRGRVSPIATNMAKLVSPEIVFITLCHQSTPRVNLYDLKILSLKC